MSDAFSYWVLQSGDKVERVQVSKPAGGQQHRHAGPAGQPGPGHHAAGHERQHDTRHQAGLVRVLPDWALTPIPLFALMPSRMVPAKTRAFLDFIQPRLNAG